MPRDSETVLAAWQKQLADLRERGAPNIKQLFSRAIMNRRGNFDIRRPHGRVVFPMADVSTKTNDGLLHLDLPDVMGTLAWMFGDVLDEKITEMIEARAGKNNGVSVEEKLSRVTDAQEELVKALRLENEILYQLELQNKFLRKHPVPITIALGIAAPVSKIIAAL